nr:uncharacterized protein LOC129276875 [Lytechinus pictus]
MSMPDVRCDPTIQKPVFTSERQSFHQNPDNEGVMTQNLECPSSAQPVLQDRPSSILASTKDATPILLGDFNNDIIGKPNKKTCNILRNFLHQESLCSLTSLHCSSSQYTFASDDGRHKSNIDGFYVHTYESSEFRGIDISEDDLNTSDHCLVSTTMRCLIQPNRESRDSMTCPTASLQAQRFKVKWNEATSEEIEMHYTIPMEKTAAALFQSYDSNLSLEANKADHLLLQLSQAMCQYSSDLPHSIAMKKKQGKPGWSTKTQEAHNEALAAWKAWKSQSNSKEGTLHDERIFAKKNFGRIYRQSIAIAEKNKITQTERASKSNQKLFYQLIKKNKGDRQQAETRSITYKNQRYEGDSLISGWQLYFKDLASGPVNTQDLVTEQLHIDSPVNNIQQGCSMAIASTCMDPEPTKPTYHGVSSMHLPSSPHVDCSPHLTLSFEDLTAAIHQLQTGRATGMDNISSEHIKHLGPVAVRLLLLAYNAFLRHSHWPENLKQGLILPFHKGKGKDAEDPKNYRGITLTSTLGKLLELCVKPALDRQLQIANTPDELQFGFRKGFSCMLTSLCLELILELNTASRLPTYTAYLDAEKAFDCVWHEGLIDKLQSIGISISLVRLIQNLHSRMESHVLWDGDVSDPIPITQGVRQGGILSPTLYTVFVDGLIKHLKSLGLGTFIRSEYAGVIALADDITLLSNSPSELQQMLEVTFQYASCWHYRINPSKSAIVVTNPRKASNQDSWTVGNDAILRTDSHTHLGILKTSTKSDQSDMIATRGLNTFYAMVGTGAYSEGLVPLVTARLWTSYCIPRMLYGCATLKFTQAMLKN